MCFDQVISALYLIYITISNIISIYKHRNDSEEEKEQELEKHEKKGSGFWMTVLKVEVADIAFAVDSILAAAAIALALPEVGGDFFGVHIGQYTVMLVGGLIEVIIMRYFVN